MTEQSILVQVKNLKKYFPIRRGVIFQKEIGAVRAVDGISFDIYRGETLGLVGESGCGKSTTGRCIVQLQRPTEGQVLYNGEDLTRLDRKGIRSTRKHIQMIFQDPYASLNPRMTVFRIISE